MMLAGVRTVAHVASTFAAGALLIALDGASPWFLAGAIAAAVVSAGAFYVDHLETETLKTIRIGRKS
jgi:hypothetical protein